MAGKVLIPIELDMDTANVEAAIDQLSKKGAVSDGAAAAYKAGNAELQKRTQLLAQEQKAMTASEAAGKKQIATIGQIGKAASAASGEVIKMSAKEFQQAMQEQGKSAQQVINALAGIEDQAQATESAESSLRQEKRRLTEEIAKLIFEGKQESEQFRELVARAGEVDDAMGDAADAIRRTGSDTRSLDNVIQLAQGITAGFTIATSAAALFGDESEETQKVLLKVNAAMALLNGLQEVQTILRSEYTKALILSVRTQLVTNTQLAIENGLQSRSVVVRTAATAAQRLLNSTMMANPIVAFIAVLTLALGALAIFKSRTEDAAEANRKFADSFPDLAQQLSDYEQYLDREGRKRIAAAKARGATEQQITAMLVAEIRKRKKAADDAFDENAKQAEHLAGLRRKLIGGIKLENLTLQELEEQEKKNAAEREVILNRRADLEAELQIQQDEARADQIKKDDEARKKAIEDQKKANDAARELAQKAALDRLALAQRLLLQEKEGTDAHLQARIRVIKAQVDADTAGAILSTNQRLLIFERAEKEIVELRRQYADASAKQAAEIEVMAAEARVAAFEEGTWRYYAAQSLLLQKRADAERLAIQQSEDSEDLKATKILALNVRLQKSLDDLRRQEEEQARQARQRAIDEAQAQYDALNALAVSRANQTQNDPWANDNRRFLAAMQVRNLELAKIDNDRAAIHQRALDGLFESDQAYQNALTDNTRQAEEKRAEIRNAYGDREKERIKLLVDVFRQAMGEALQAFFDADNEARAAALEAHLTDLNTRREAALENENLTKKQKRDIEKRYAAEERRIKLAAWKADQDAKVDQAIMAGALAVINALATAPTIIAGIALAAGVGITTGIQIARIRAQQPPQFAKGTRYAPRGMAWVGEEGPELVHLNGGERIWTAKESENISQAWSDRASRNIPVQNSEAMSVSPNGELEIDYDKLGESFAKHMPEPVVVQNTFDEEGHSSYINRAGHRQRILNKRYTTRTQ